MTYTVTKIIKGNPYLYEVRSERDGDRVRQVFVRYLGRADKQGQPVPPEVLKDYPELKPTTPVEVKPELEITPTPEPPMTEKRKRYLSFQENVQPMLHEYGNSLSGSSLNDKFMNEYMEPLRDEKGVIGRTKWAEASKKFYDEHMIPINLADYLTFDSRKSPVSPYPDYRFRTTSYEEWQNMLKGDRSGAFWSGEPKNYASAIGDYPDTVVLVTKANDTGNQKYVAGREDNGSILLDNIVAVYRGNPEKHMAERIYEKPDADLSELDGIKPEILEPKPVEPEPEEEKRPYPMSPQERRRAILESRIKRGEPVPDKLLAEFPDLKTETSEPDDFDLVKRIWEAKNFNTKQLAKQYNIPVNKMYKKLSELEDNGLLYGWHFSGEERGKTGNNLKSLEWTVNTDKQADIGGTIEELRDFYNEKIIQPAPEVTPPPVEVIPEVKTAGILTLKEMTPEQKDRYYIDLKNWQDKGLSKWEAVKASRRTITYDMDKPEFQEQLKERKKNKTIAPPVEPEKDMPDNQPE